MLQGVRITDGIKPHTIHASEKSLLLLLQKSCLKHDSLFDLNYKRIQSSWRTVFMDFILGVSHVYPWIMFHFYNDGCLLFVDFSDFLNLSDRIFRF